MRKISSNIFFIFNFFFLSSPSIHSCRAELTHDFAIWNATISQGYFSEPWGYYFENQLRIYQNSTSATRFLLRPALRYSPLSQLHLFLGYAWTPSFAPLKSENRIWQQAIYTESPSNWELALRLRFEERWITETDGIAIRVRLMIRALAFLDEARTLAICSTDEILYAINSVTSGPAAGTDQNRFFLGLNYRLGKNIQIEPGFTQIWQNRTGQPTDLLTHAWTLYVYVNP